VVFTEFVPTQEMLLEVLAAGGIPAVSVNGSMSIAERRDAQHEFRTSARVLISTDAGGEGINLQFAHVVVNYDLPWSPTRIEQRIGRVDRIGQARDVVAYNLVLESSIDGRVLAVLEEKLAVILAELGVDKSSDVLASVTTRVEELYTSAILDPAAVEATAEELDRQAREDVEAAAPLRNALGAAITPERRPGPTALKRWLDLAEAAQARLARRNQNGGLPEVVPGEPVPRVAGATAGWWTMWDAGVGADRICLALFFADTGAIRPDLAERLWMALAEAPAIRDTVVLDATTLSRLHAAAADHAYRQTDNGLPSLTLRLAVRVEP
jgi:superfamily II DNA/RNA helicase